MSSSNSNSGKNNENLEDEIEQIVKVWREKRDKIEDEIISIKDLAKELGESKSKLSNLLIDVLNKIMNKIEDNYIFKDELMEMFGITKRDFEEILKKAGYESTESKVYKNIKVQLLLRLDPMALDLIEDCIPYYGSSKTAVVRQMIIDFYTKHHDEIEKVRRSH
ncbi:MAG: hypothetical protein ACTSWR_07660 [Candidatus Helarchaeota archaeon]